MLSKLSILKQSSYTFEGKREDEEVTLFLYSHWLIIVLKLVYYVALTLIPLVPIIFFAREIYNYQIGPLISTIIFGYYMILWSGFCYELMIYLLDTWIVTNERVIDILQRGFFLRTVSELDLARVQDISVRTNGLIQTLFDFGDVEIQSAGAINKFRFHQVAHPQLVKDRIARLVMEAKKKSDPTP